MLLIRGALPDAKMAGRRLRLRPVQMADFPDTLAAIVNRKLASARLTVEAALQGDRRLFVEALLADGAVRERKLASDLGEALLEAHRGSLPNFF